MNRAKTPAVIHMQMHDARCHIKTWRCPLLECLPPPASTVCLQGPQMTSFFPAQIWFFKLYVFSKDEFRFFFFFKEWFVHLSTVKSWNHKFRPTFYNSSLWNYCHSTIEVHHFWYSDPEVLCRNQTSCWISLDSIYTPGFWQVFPFLHNMFLHTFSWLCSFLNYLQTVHFASGGL